MKKKILIITSCILAITICLCGILIPEQKEIKDSLQTIQNVVNNDIETYEMSEEEIEELPTTEIIEQTIEDEEAIEEQEVEDESFELQGEIAYEGDRATTWNVELGDYKGLTYYSQIDSRWKNNLYTSTGNSSQTIGSSGCGPTSSAMVVTACKGAITPDTMANLFVKYGYRSANNGTYWSAFRAVADEFNIEYQETIYLNNAVELLKNSNIIITSCGNGLFTTGGHFIVLTGIEGDYIKIYDPYLYAGKFDTSTRRGKATVNGNIVYVTIENFREYANYSRFFCYKNEGNQVINDTKPVITQPYNRYVKVNSILNVRSGAGTNYSIVGSLKNNEQVTVYETSDNWSKIGSDRWVCSDYLVSSMPAQTSIINYNTNIGSYYRLKNATIMYSNSNLTGMKYNYLPNTQIKVINHISSAIDYIYVVKTGRYAYCSTNAYSSTITVKGTIGQYKRLRTNSTLYSNSNLSGTRYNYLANTQIKIIKNINNNIDYVYVIKTGRYAYIKNNIYR